jgi:membrane protein implicated in regulation of membrane protease activity
MAQLRKLLLVIGKVLLALALGCVAFIVASTAIAILFGVLQGLFGWPVPTSGTRNLILLAVFVVAYLIYRDRRKQKEDDPEEILAEHKRRLTAALMESKKGMGTDTEPKN